MCPACGSKYPNDALISAAVVVGVVAAAILGLGAAVNVDALKTIGIIGLLGAAGLLALGLPRNGPPQKESCCGCTCAVIILALPASGLALYATGGPELAVVAIPAWLPLVWAIDLTTTTACSLGRRIQRRFAHG